MSWNRTAYTCRCGSCKECRDRENEKGIYKRKPMPRDVASFAEEKRQREEEGRRLLGFVIVNCPKCRRDREVQGSTLKHGFTCDKCGFIAK